MKTTVGLIIMFTVSQAYIPTYTLHNLSKRSPRNWRRVCKVKSILMPETGCQIKYFVLCRNKC